MLSGLNSEPGRRRIAAAFRCDRPLQTTWPKTCFLRQAYAAFVVPRGAINRKSCPIYGERKIHNADGEGYNYSPDGIGRLRLATLVTPLQSDFGQTISVGLLQFFIAVNRQPTCGRKA
jgi:hypothetical protein